MEGEMSREEEGEVSSEEARTTRAGSARQRVELGWLAHSPDLTDIQR